MLVQVLSGNAVSAAAVWQCLNTADTVPLRQLHPEIAIAIAGVPWADTVTTVGDIARWRAALPAAVGLRASKLCRSPAVQASLAGVTSMNLASCRGVSDISIGHLPPTLRVLDVSNCCSLTLKANFLHLTALEVLDCTATEALDAWFGHLPPSLRKLRMGLCNPPATTNFKHLTALRVFEICSRSTHIKKALLDSLPPSLEELATPSWPPGTSLARLTALRVLRVADSGIDDAAFATLPPSLVSLDLSCRERGTTVALTAAAVFSHLPALRVLDVSCTGVGDASVASMPAGLEVLRMAGCRGVTQRASLEHLTALRELFSPATDLSRATLAACRARGCDAPADGIVTTTADFSSLAVLPDGRLVNSPSKGRVALWDPTLGSAPVAEWEFWGWSVKALAALPDSQRVAVGVSDVWANKGDVRVWDTRGGVGAPIDVDSCVESLAALPDGRLVAGGRNGNLEVVDPHKSAVVATLRGHTGWVTALVVLPGGGLASASSGGTVRLWDVATWASDWQLNVLATALAVLPDGRLACGAGNGTVRLWDVGRRACVGTLLGDLGPIPIMVHKKVSALTVLTDNRLAGVSADGALRVWDTRDATAGASEVTVPDVVTVVFGVTAGSSPLGLSLAPLPDGRLATCTGYDGGLQLWHLPAASVMIVATNPAAHLAEPAAAPAPVPVAT